MVSGIQSIQLKISYKLYLIFAEETPTTTITTTTYDGNLLVPGMPSK